MRLLNEIQPAFYARDEWPRGLKYVRRAAIVDADGRPVDFTGWTTLQIGVEGQGDTRLTAGSTAASAAFVDETGLDGVKLGLIDVTLDARLLELDRKENALRQNEIRYTVLAQTTNNTPRAVMQVALRVLDTAFL